MVPEVFGLHNHSFDFRSTPNNFSLQSLSRQYCQFCSCWPNFSTALLPIKIVNASSYTVHVPLLVIKNAACLFKDVNGEVEYHCMENENAFILFLKQFFDCTKINVIIFYCRHIVHGIIFFNWFFIPIPWC